MLVDTQVVHIQSGTWISFQSLLMAIALAASQVAVLSITLESKRGPPYLNCL